MGQILFPWDLGLMHLPWAGVAIAVSVLINRVIRYFVEHHIQKVMIHYHWYRRARDASLFLIVLAVILIVVEVYFQLVT